MINDMAGNQAEPVAPRVFISYSHDTLEHKERVLRLSARLRKDGIETCLDQYVPGTPTEKWHRWMLNQIDLADFVLSICTETYYRRFRGFELPGKGKGADWEGAIITQEVYDARNATVKFVPVLFDAADEGFIPEPLLGHTYYVLESSYAYQSLCNFLLGHGGLQPPPIEKRKPIRREHPEPLSFIDESRVPIHPSAVNKFIERNSSAPLPFRG